MFIKAYKSTLVDTQNMLLYIKKHKPNIKSIENMLI